MCLNFARSRIGHLVSSGLAQKRKPADGA